MVKLVKKVVIFGVDNSFSAHTDNRKNSILVLGECPIDKLGEAIIAAETKFSKKKICMKLLNNEASSFVYTNGNKPINSK